MLPAVVASFGSDKVRIGLRAVRQSWYDIFERAWIGMKFLRAEDRDLHGPVPATKSSMTSDDLFLPVPVRIKDKYCYVKDLSGLRLEVVLHVLHSPSKKVSFPLRVLPLLGNVEILDFSNRFARSHHVNLGFVSRCSGLGVSLRQSPLLPLFLEPEGSPAETITVHAFCCESCPQVARHSVLPDCRL